MSRDRTWLGTWRHIAGLTVRAAPGTLALHAVVVLVSAALPVATSWLTKLLLDHLIRGGALSHLIALGAGLAVAAAGVSLGPRVSQYLLAELDRRVGVAAQSRLFGALDRQPGLARFESPEFLDRLRLAQQSGATSPSRAVDGLLGVGGSAVTIAGFLGSLLVLSPVMAAVVLVTAIPCLLAELSLSRQRARMLWRIGPTERRELFYGDLLSTVSAAKEIRLFGLGAFFRGRMVAERVAANQAKRSLERRELRLQAVLGLVAALVAGAGLLWAVRAAHEGRLTVGDITIFVAAVAGVQGTLAVLTQEIAGTHHALLMFGHFTHVTGEEPDLVTPSRPVRLPELRGGIEFRDVWFRYSAEHPWILRGVNLRLAGGSTTALVGLNGAGKSTLVKLLARFYDPTRGSITWDGVDLRDADPADLRQRVGAVFQDYMRYDLTALENIALGDLAAFRDQPRIEGAARRAGVHRVLTGLPRGYHTLLSRMFFDESDRNSPGAGTALSGGQWQRLALARASLRDEGELMILDEPSAGLDAEAETEIHAALAERRRGRTNVVITHRLGAARNADSIVVLSDGVVSEHGDHEALMAENGEYARLFSLQASGYQPALSP